MIKIRPKLEKKRIFFIFGVQTPYISNNHDTHVVYFKT